MRLNREFIALPWRFDAARLAEELAQFDGMPWMDHPDNTEGNSAIALISCGGGDNNGFRGEMKMTPHLARCPYVQQVIASFGEVFGRSRFMRLQPGCEVKEHVDYHYHWHTHVRIHVPVITNPEVQFHCGGRHVHMEAGSCWIFDSWRRHHVVNGGSEARTHLVIDTSGSSRFWELVERAERALDAGETLPVRHVPWEPGHKVNIVTERYNLQPVLSPGEIEHLVEDLIADIESVVQNDRRSVAAYRRIMRAFCHDWRALWYRYGIHRNGWQHYARLVGRARQALPDDDPPLRLGNGLGLAKSAVRARILAVAVSPEVYEDFVVPPAVPTDAGDRGQTRTRPDAPETPPAPRSPERSPEDGALAAAKTGVPRNAPCPCGSGRRFKHCHGIDL